MKTQITIILAVLISVCSFAQQGINYKAIIKDANSNVMANASISLRATIIDEGDGRSSNRLVDYVETHDVTTDQNGMVIINLGEGVPVSSDFDMISWYSENQSLKIEIDSGSGFIDLGTTELKTVPYAFYADTVGEHDHLGEIWTGSNPLTIETTGFFNYGVLRLNNDNGHGLEILAANQAGVRIANVDGSGVYVNDAGENGISVQQADTYGGFFKGDNAGLFAAATTDSHADIILGGGGTQNEDEGIISSEIEGRPSSDLWLKSNDAVVIVLDQNNDEEGDFEIKANNSPAVIFNVSEDGKVGIGTSTPSTSLQITNGGDANLNDGSGFLVLGSENSINMVMDQNEIMVRQNAIANTLFLQRDGGDVWVGGNIVHSSDKRLKEDIHDLSYGLNEILQLEPKTYYWKNRDQSKKSLGLIAQDVQPVINEIVKTADDEMKTLSISYTELIPVLINAIKEQHKIITNQQKNHSHLLERVIALEANNQ